MSFLYRVLTVPRLLYFFSYSQSRVLEENKIKVGKIEALEKMIDPLKETINDQALPDFFDFEQKKIVLLITPVVK
jgi:hypothetical protein